MECGWVGDLIVANIWDRVTSAGAASGAPTGIRVMARDFGGVARVLVGLGTSKAPAGTPEVNYWFEILAVVPSNFVRWTVKFSL